MFACRADGAGLRSFITFFLGKGHGRSRLQLSEAIIQHAVLVKVELAAIVRLDKTELAGRVEAIDNSGRLRLMMFGLALEPPSAILKLATGTLEGGAGTRHGHEAACDHKSQRASSLAENLVRDARVCQAREGRLLLSKRAEVQDKVREARIQRPVEPRRRHHVANGLRPYEDDRRRRGKDRRPCEEGRWLTTNARYLAPSSASQP